MSEPRSLLVKDASGKRKYITSILGGREWIIIIQQVSMDYNNSASLSSYNSASHLAEIHLINSAVAIIS